VSLGWRRGLATTVVVVAVALPAVRNRDSFPLSTYPVYATARGSTVTLATAVAVDADGTVQRLSLRTIARTDDPLIAESFVDEAIDSGRADALCRDIAGRAPDGSTAIEVVEERHDVIAHAEGDDSLLERTVHARCSVG
jgi:hypothetical protein